MFSIPNQFNWSTQPFCQQPTTTSTLNKRHLCDDQDDTQQHCAKKLAMDMSAMSLIFQNDNNYNNNQNQQQYSYPIQPIMENIQDDVEMRDLPKHVVYIHDIDKELQDELDTPHTVLPDDVKRHLMWPTVADNNSQCNALVLWTPPLLINTKNNNVQSDGNNNLNEMDTDDNALTR